MNFLFFPQHCKSISVPLLTSQKALILAACQGAKCLLTPPTSLLFFSETWKLQQVRQAAKTQRASSQTDWKQSGCFLDVCAALERMNWLWSSLGCRMVIDKWELCEIFNWCHTCTDVVKHRGIQLLCPKKRWKNKVKNNANSKITVITCSSPLLPVPFALPSLHLFDLHRQNAQIQPC